ncbi:MAG TPA: SoxR reducing system RseC family protein [Clostridia bacterium]|nr:SoxR reducing system RseC family protein [Clostridia bacterium]
MTDNGHVIELKGKDAVVRIYRSSACGNCSMCGLTSDKKYIDIEVENTLDAKVGEQIEISFNDTSAFKVSAIVYLIPLFAALLLMLIGYFMKVAEWILCIVFVAGLSLGFLIVRYIDKNYAKNSKLVPRMVKIIKETEKNE